MSQPTLSVQGQVCYNNYVTKLNEYNSKNDAISGLGICFEKQYGQNILPPEGSCDAQYQKKIQEYQNSDEFKNIKKEYDQCIFVNNTKAPEEEALTIEPEDTGLSGGVIAGIVVISIVILIFIWAIIIPLIMNMLAKNSNSWYDGILCNLYPKSWTEGKPINCRQTHSLF